MQPNRATQRTDRDPDSTRQRLIEAAFHEIHRHGYQGMRLDDVLAATGITKGGLYHHFSSKKALAYAVIDTVIHAYLEEVWLAPMEQSKAPLNSLIGIVRSQGETATQELVTLGCPLNNLSQEMSPLDEGFRRRLSALYRLWKDGIVSAIERGKRLGQIRQTVNAEESAVFILAALEGCIGMAKSEQSTAVLRLCGAGLLDYLTSLEHRHPCPS